MTEETALDRAAAGMAQAPDDAAARLRFHERLADAELVLLLDGEPAGDTIAPRVFETEAGRFVLAFDREERLAAFTGGAAAFAALPGRELVAMIAGQGLGIALNPSVAPSETLLGADAVDWLARTLAARPEPAEARPETVAPPAGLPGALVAALDAKLAAIAGRARHAWLAAVTYPGGSQGHWLAFVDAAPGAEAALARAVGETLVFSGLDAGTLDVTFLKAGDPVEDRLARVGLRFDLPAPQDGGEPAPPGSDPDRPPILR